MVGGLGLVGASVAAAGRASLTEPDRLVVAGPYALSRNPMYVGWAALHVGIGLVTGSGWVLTTLPPAGAAIQRQVRREEAALAASFGPAFDAYRARVPRYVPGPPQVGITWRPRSGAGGTRRSSRRSGPADPGAASRGRL